MSRVRVDSPAEWSNACSEAFVPLRVRGASPRFRASLAQTELAPGVTLTHVSSGASEVYRSSQLITASPRDDVLLSLHRRGTGTVMQSGRRAKLAAGKAALYDTSAPYTLSFPTRISEVVLQVPRRTINRVGHAFTDLTARTLPDGPSLRALMSLAASVGTRPSYRGSVEDAALAEALVSLLRAVLAGQGVDDAPSLDEQVLLTAMRAYVDDHLTDASLSPKGLAAAHHVSLRLVQRVFAADRDSPAAFIRRRRLAHAHRMLVAGEQVGVAAARSGFNDPDTFSRAFKREFGVAPSTTIG